MNWSVPPIWEGGDVWILGGGPSVTEQFGIPDKIVQDVISGALPPTVYSPYMAPIHNQHVIGINVAYLIGDWIDAMFFGDNKFFQMHKERLAVWPGLKISCLPSTVKVPWVKCLGRDPSRPYGISNNPSMVSWNVNSGSAAISVAANAGAARIILVGFDMSRDSKGKQHWHNFYGTIEPPPLPPRRKGYVITNLPSFNRHLQGFNLIAKHAKERGIEILNFQSIL
jgi:hypothetical protein